MLDLNTEDSSSGATEVATDQATDQTIESAESVGNGAEATTETESELEYYQIGDIEATVDEIREWKEAHSKKQDTDKAWTQKTQALSADKKALDEKMQAYDSKLEAFNSLEGELDSFILGEYASVDLDKVLNEEGTDEYLRIQREIDKRRSLKSGLSQKLAKIREESIANAQKALHEMLGWADSAKQQSDVKAISSYVKEVNMPDADFNKINSPHVMSAFLEAAKYRELMSKREQTEKQVKKAPKVATPAATKQSSAPKSLAERMYGKR